MPTWSVASNFSWLSLWPSQAAPQPERALLFEGGPSGRTGKPIEGKTTWRTRTEPGSSGGKADTVVTLDVQIPDPPIALTATISRVSDAGSSMSHLLEMQFGRPQDAPFGGVSRLSSISMKGAETESGESLVGTSINIAPGQFMFGLLGVQDVVQQNVARLRTQNWLDFTIIFGNGAAYTLSVEKGASGTKVINEALAKWGAVSGRDRKRRPVTGGRARAAPAAKPPASFSPRARRNRDRVARP